MEWTSQIETRECELKPGIISTQTYRAFVSSTGVRIEGLGITREWQRWLLYKDDAVTFKFFASRYDVYGKKILDTYDVVPDPFHFFRKLCESRDVGKFTRERMALIMANIESALRVYPPIAFAEQDVPLRHIHFTLFETI